MSSKIARANVASVLRSRSFSAQAAHKHEGHHALPKQQLKQTKLPNGLVVAALENYSPISRVGVFVRAGPRFEAPGQLGINHALRNAAGLSTKTSTIFGITRNVEYGGGRITATNTREDISYVLTSDRDNIGANLRFLADTVTRPAFKPWELEDYAYRMNIDVARLHHNPEAQLLEAVHQAAFRGGLRNPLYAPEYLIGKYDHNDLLSYVTDNFLTSRMAVVGLGVELGALVEAIEKNFSLNSASAPKVPDSKYVGGDLRVGTHDDVALTAVVTEGAGYE